MSEEEILKRLDRLEKIANYAVIPKLIEEREHAFKNATGENERTAYEIQLKNLRKHLVGFGTLLDLYDAHNPAD